MTTIAVIGGTGMNQWPGLQIERRIVIDTPFGATIAPLLEGSVYGTHAIFLARQGEGHKIPPHCIHYRANPWALHHRSEEHTSDIQSLIRTSYAVFCL